MIKLIISEFFLSKGLRIRIPLFYTFFWILFKASFKDLFDFSLGFRSFIIEFNFEEI